MDIKILTPYEEYYNSSISGRDISIEKVQMKFHFTINEAKKIIKKSIQNEKIHFSEEGGQIIIADEMNAEAIQTALAKSISGPMKNFNVIDHDFSNLNNSNNNPNSFLVWIMVEFEKIPFITLFQYVCQTYAIKDFERVDMLAFHNKVGESEE